MYIRYAGRRAAAAIALCAIMATPLVAEAQQTSTTLFDLLGFVNAIINQAIPVVVSLAFLFFVWGLAKFILLSGDEKRHEEGRNIMIWGIIALFVLVSVWGIVNLVGNLTGIPQANAPTLPRLPTPAP